jgi:hypothetical protein
MGKHTTDIKPQWTEDHSIIFWPEIGHTSVNRAIMKTIIQFLYTFTNLAFSKEKMPALIPVRVVTKIHPHHR